MKSFQIIINFLILFVSCEKRNEEIGTLQPNESTEVEKIARVYESSFEVDTILENQYERRSSFKLYPSDTVLKLYGACRCEKNSKGNSLKIQVWTYIPTRAQLDTLKDPEFIRKKFLDKISFSRQFGKEKPFEGQLKLVNIELKDSLVKSINLISKSTDSEYDGKSYKNDQINKFKIKSSRNYYSNVSKVYGEFELILNEDFGISHNDTILRGTFSCWNGTVYSEKSIKNWDLKR